jgi:hypothetical protein
MIFVQKMRLQSYAFFVAWTTIVANKNGITAKNKNADDGLKRTK